jgi:2-polyprenyl-3-methyl-5-hydroxy-6-metoxy-1,4-benzoquinol methylase
MQELSQNAKEDIRCCVCNNSDSNAFRLVYKRENFDVASCNSCGFYFIPPFYRKQIQYQQYKNEAVTQAIRSGNNWVKIQRHLLRFNLIRKYKPQGSLFDLGAGWGHFMLAGKQLGYDVYGIEISEQPFLYCKNDLKLNVDHLDFFKMDESKKFDVITMWDVLEHIDRADDFIEKCTKIQNKNGLLVLQVPQIDSYFAKKYQSEWKMMGLDHVNYFSKKTITHLLNRYGYEVKTIKSSLELKLFIMYTILPFLKRLKSKKKITQQEANYQINQAERQQFFNKFTNRPMWQLKLFVFIHNIVYNFLSFLNIGEEMIVVATKKNE